MWDIQTILVLQGGGARAAYQWGVYDALRAAGLEPDWTLGISSGALNAAAIAANPVEDRPAQLERLWRSIENPLDPSPFAGPLAGMARAMSALSTNIAAPGFHHLRMIPPFLQPPGSPGATSMYSQAPLRRTLTKVTDLDGYNASGEGRPDKWSRLSLGATDARTGELVFFDSRDGPITLDHIQASGALPPGAAGRTVDGGLYWDGGLAANSPLDYVLSNIVEASAINGPTLVVVVDLWWIEDDAPPKDLSAIAWRKYQVAYVSKARQSIERFKTAMHLATNELILTLTENHPDPENAGAVPLFAGQVLGLHLKWGATIDPKPFAPIDFTRTAIEERRATGRAHLEQALEDSRAVERLRSDTLFGEIRGYRDLAFDGSQTDLHLPLIDLYRLYDGGKLPSKVKDLVESSAKGRFHLEGRPPPGS